MRTLKKKKKFMVEVFEKRRSNILISYFREKYQELGIKEHLMIEAVLRIHDILWWIRIRIRGSMPLTNGSGSRFGSGSRILLFSALTFKMPTKKLFKKKFFFILLFEGTFTSFSKGKKSKRSHKTVDLKVFLTIFA